MRVLCILSMTLPLVLPACSGGGTGAAVEPPSPPPRAGEPAPAPSARSDDAAALLAKYGLATEGVPTDALALVPTDFGASKPFTDYQAASAAIGLDLRTVAGKNVTIRSYVLAERTKTGGAVHAYVASFEGRSVGAWLAPDDGLMVGALDDASVFDA